MQKCTYREQKVFSLFSNTRVQCICAHFKRYKAGRGENSTTRPFSTGFQRSEDENECIGRVTKNSIQTRMISATSSTKLQHSASTIIKGSCSNGLCAVRPKRRERFYIRPVLFHVKDPIDFATVFKVNDVSAIVYGMCVKCLKV